MDGLRVTALTVAALVGQGSHASGDPRTFAPGIVSTPAIEDAIAFSPDGEFAVFARRAGAWGGPPEPGTLFASRRLADGWSRPVPVPFSGRHDDGDPSFAPDGSRLFFVSSRPAPDGRVDPDLWSVAFDGTRWGEPVHLGDAINSPAAEYSPSLAASGRLYFASMRDGGLGQGDIWVADAADEAFAAPRNLGPAVNSATGEWNVTVAPDESYLLFEASGRPANRSASGDLYVSYRAGQEWSRPIALDAVNTEQSELNARLSPDGAQFLFTRSTPADAGRQADILSLAAGQVLPHLADPAHARVAAVSRSAHEAFVLEAGSWRTLARLPTGRGPHEIGVSPDGRRAYTADYGQYPAPHEGPVDPAPPRWVEEDSGSITAVDLERLRPLRKIRIDRCRRNHGILVARDGRRLWTTCEEEGAVLEIDAESGATLRRFATATGSHQLLETPDETLLIASNVESGSVSLISLGDGVVTTLPAGRGAEGLALSPDGRRLWVGNGLDGTLSIFDLVTLRPVATVPSGGRFPVKLAFSADGREVGVVNTAPRAIVAFDARSRALARTLTFESPPLGILALPDGNMLVSFPRLNEVAVLSAADGARLATVRGIIEADGLAWIPAIRRGQTP